MIKQKRWSEERQLFFVFLDVESHIHIWKILCNCVLILYKTEQVFRFHKTIHRWWILQDASVWARMYWEDPTRFLGTANCSMIINCGLIVILFLIPKSSISWFWWIRILPVDGIVPKTGERPLLHTG